MSREEDAKDARLFDLRTVERNIKRGLITRKDYERHLKSLPDASDNVIPSEQDAPHAPAPAPAAANPPASAPAPAAPATQE